MRAAFFDTLADLADEDDRIVLLTGDLGYSVIERFADRHPRRFFNMGVSEQNMVGVATGLAESRFIPFTYSIATFSTLRPYEFIRNGPVLHSLPIRIVGVGGGFEYGVAGATHHGLEDIGVMRMQPGLTVVCPYDHRQARSALRATWALPGPIYYRIGKDDRRELPDLDGSFALSTLTRFGHGRDVALVVTGAIAHEALAAASMLSALGIDAATFVVSTISPMPLVDIARALFDHALIVTVEAHYVTGGLGSLVAEAIGDCALPARLVRLGVESLSDGCVGGETFLLGKHGLSAQAIANRIRIEINGGAQQA